MSSYLEGIIQKQHGSTPVTVVFLDVIKYSLRKSIAQQKIIHKFNMILAETLNEISAKYVVDAQKNSINLMTDIIKVPTGDGAAVVFPFSGFQNIHLEFALAFMRVNLQSRGDLFCEHFEKKSWCNCHDFVNVRIGVADGKAIVYKDVNGHFNVAGGAINIAARVMNLGDDNQILFTEAAFRNIIDMTEDMSLEEKFKTYYDINIKHDLAVNVCQYVGAGENFINTAEPMAIKINNKKTDLFKSNPAMFPRKISLSHSDQLEQLEKLEILKGMPLPQGMTNMVSDLDGIDKDKLSRIVEAFKAVDFLLSGAQGGRTIGQAEDKD